VIEADPYFLGYRRREQERLERQAQEFAHESAWLFDEIGVREGWRVVEIGCGPQGCLGLLSRRVGASGRVVGVERNAEQVETARSFIAASHVANVEVLHADGRGTGLPDGAFDLATSRLVLVNVPEPEQIVAEMVRLIRPGGAVAFHEPDPTTQRIEPAHPAQDRVLELLAHYAALNGIDRSIALRVPRMLREAGIIDVRVNPLVHVYPPGHGRRMLVPEFAENLRGRAVEKGLIAEAELREGIAALRRHLEDPGTLVVGSLFLQVWGRKPDGSWVGGGFDRPA
jgi:SAM-dependent methyltransferase